MKTSTPEKTLIVFAYMAMIIGILAFLITFSKSPKYADFPGVQESMIVAAFAYLVGGVGSWALLMTIANISLTLKSIAEKEKTMMKKVENDEEKVEDDDD